MSAIKERLVKEINGKILLTQLSPDHRNSSSSTHFPRIRWQVKRARNTSLTDGSEILIIIRYDQRSFAISVVLHIALVDCWMCGWPIGARRSGAFANNSASWSAFVGRSPAP